MHSAESCSGPHMLRFMGIHATENSFISFVEPQQSKMAQYMRFKIENEMMSKLFK